MALGTIQGVQDLCGSTDTELISRQLVKARAIVTKMLFKQGIAAPSSDVVLDTAVEYFAASMVATLPGAVNPRSNFTADAYSRKDGNLSQLDELKFTGIELVNDYTASNISSPPGSAIVGTAGRRVGAYEEMSSDDEVNY